MRLVLRGPRSGRLPVRLLAALVVTAAVALLTPGVSYAAGQAAADRSAPVGVHCVGVHPVAFNPQGFITDQARSQGGHLWWQLTAHGSRVCIGTVVEWVQYNTTATKTWRVIVYSAQHPSGQVVAQRTFTLGPGWYWWSFGVHQVFSGLSAVCITADDSFGAPCLHFGSSSG